MNVSTIKAAGGLCAPISTRYALYDRPRPDIWPNRIQRMSRLRRWFSWDKGWGFPLRGGVVQKVRELFPVVRASREPINYFKVAR